MGVSIYNDDNCDLKLLSDFLFITVSLWKYKLLDLFLFFFYLYSSVIFMSHKPVGLIYSMKIWL